MNVVTSPWMRTRASRHLLVLALGLGCHGDWRASAPPPVRSSTPEPAHERELCLLMMERATACFGVEPEGGPKAAIERCRASHHEKRRDGRFNDALEKAWLECFSAERCEDTKSCVDVVTREADEANQKLGTAKRRINVLAWGLLDECRELDGALRPPPMREQDVTPVDQVCDRAAELCDLFQDLTSDEYADRRDGPDPKRMGFDRIPCDVDFDGAPKLPEWRARLRVKKARETIMEETPP